MKSYALRFLGSLVVSAVLLGSLFLYFGRFATYQHAEDMASGILDFGDSFVPRAQITEMEIMAYATNAVPPTRGYPLREISLGFFNGAEVIAEEHCGEECGEKLRVIRFIVPVARTCSQIGGVERSVRVISRTAYCFPEILVENWDLYWQNNFAGLRRLTVP